MPQNDLDPVRAAWLEGKAAVGLGRTTQARGAFEQTRRELTSRGMAYDCALVTLELAELLLGLGDTAEVQRLAKDMLWIFKARGIHREALAALELFRDTARKEKATPELVRRLIAYLNRARNKPELRFEA
jgi:hypothetical protein